jgi:hypothetical protein
MAFTIPQRIRVARKESHFGKELHFSRAKRLLLSASLISRDAATATSSYDKRVVIKRL